jgi:alpha-beta hydrolase superfamily lysophospholipase
LVRLYYYLVRGFIKERPRTFSTNADNPEFIAFLRDADILQARTLPVQWVTAMISWMKRFENYPATDIAPLVVQGQSDQTVDWKYNMGVMERLFEPQVLYIPEARHHLVNESEAIRAQIFAAIDAELER